MKGWFLRIGRLFVPANDALGCVGYVIFGALAILIFYPTCALVPIYAGLVAWTITRPAGYFDQHKKIKIFVVAELVFLGLVLLFMIGLWLSPPAG